MAWRLERRFKAGSGRGIRFVPDVSGRFFVQGNSMLLCMEICKEVRYNFDTGRERQIKIYKKG